MDAEELLQKLEPRNVTTIGLVALLDAAGVEDGKRLEVTLTREPATRAETPPRNHVFHDADGLVAYVRRYGGKETTVYVNAPNGTAAVVLDENADGGQEFLYLRPQIHPRWAPWKALAAKQSIPLSEFVDFLRNNRKSITAPEGRSLVLTLSQIKASTDITLHEGHGNGALNGLLVKTKIGGTKPAGGDSVIELPERLTVRSPIFVGDEPADVEIDVLLEGSPDGRSVTVRLASADAKEAEIAAFERVEERLAALEEEPGAAVVRGVPEFGAWKYND